METQAGGVSQALPTVYGTAPTFGAPLLGVRGQEYVQARLSTADPTSAIKDIQTHGALKDERCVPLLGLLDQLGLPRSESHGKVLASAIDALLQRVSNGTPDKLLRLLELSFPYCGIPIVSAVPFAVLQRLRPVPATYLKQLAADADLFWAAPLEVRRQVWELDKKLLITHALPLVSSYIHETATVTRVMDMDEDGATTTDPSQTPLPQLSRKTIRKGSASLQKLAQMVGSNQIVYKGIVELCVARFRDTEEYYIGHSEASLCSLRSQLLMALHDGGEIELCSRDPIHKLVWLLDSSLSEHGFDTKKVKELSSFIIPLAFAARQRVAESAAASRRGRGSRRTDDDAESAGAPGLHRSEGPLRDLGESGMVIRDPPVFYTLIHHALHRLDTIVENQGVPGSDRELQVLCRLLKLATLSQDMMKQNDFYLPDPPNELLSSLLPLLAEQILESKLREDIDDFPMFDSGQSSAASLIALMVDDELSRRLTEALALQRLAAGDLATASWLLHAIAATLELVMKQPAVIEECSSFAYSLARRLAFMTRFGAFEPSHTLWELCVDGLLIRLVDSDLHAHEEILRLLLATSDQLAPEVLASYLTKTLQGSRQSRRKARMRKRNLSEVEITMHDYDELPSPSAGEHAKGSDGVRGTYALFPQRVPELDSGIAPVLFAYLNSID